VQFTLSTPNPPNIVNGETTHWVRGRIVRGNYGSGSAYGQPINLTTLIEDTEETNKGLSESEKKTLKVDSVRGFMPKDRIKIAMGSNKEKEANIEKVDTTDNNKLTLDKPLQEYYQKGTSVIIVSNSASGPPSLKSLSLSYTYEASSSLSACYAYNDFHYNHGTQAVRSFAPFTPTADQSPTLYLGFDKPFPHRSIALYLQVESPQPGEITKATQNRNKPRTDSPRIIWEYYDSKGWVSLGVKDETKAFTQWGIIEFSGPTDFTPRNEFGQTLYWIRARWESGEFLVQPRLRRILTNTIWASQEITIKEELLGSSDGQPKQTYRTAQFPVLKGQRLEVRSPQVPSADELAALEKSLGKNALTIVRDDLGRVEEVWVMWEKVRDFYGSSQTDRHYTIDHLTGLVQFGDGVQGMIPPQGRNNIRLAQYRTGGGKKGNLAENRIAQLKTTIPYVESVTNLEAAGGGAEQESLERVKERGPKWLRHRDRAVTWQDFEDLAYEATPDVARAKAIVPQFDPFSLWQNKWLPVFDLSVNQPGEIKVELTDLPETSQLEVKLYSPGKATPYAPNKESGLITYTVTQDDLKLQEDLKLGNNWTLAIAITNTEEQEISVRVKITYPSGSPLEEELRFKPKNDLSISKAGVVELIVVPHSTASQPVPSISLLDRVKTYIRDRCSPAIDLRITEPDWVEVSVATQIVPISMEVGDRVKAALENALLKFLHPLTGGRKGQGWAFGRRPHESDLYALLESLEGVDYVKSLSFTEKPLSNSYKSVKELIKERPNQFLIFSGIHKVMINHREKI